MFKYVPLADMLMSVYRCNNQTRLFLLRMLWKYELFIEDLGDIWSYYMVGDPWSLVLPGLDLHPDFCHACAFHIHFLAKTGHIYNFGEPLLSIFINSSHIYLWGKVSHSPSHFVMLVLSHIFLVEGVFKHPWLWSGLPIEHSPHTARF
jgi:hypothetical protein